MRHLAAVDAPSCPPARPAAASESTTSARQTEDDIDLELVDDGQSSTSATRQRYQCPQCDKSYARSEHLARHAKSHDNHTHTCTSCGKEFARLDVLKRHQKQHLPDEASPDSRRGASLRRTKKACHNCYRAKLRCDGEQPCFRCSSTDKECSYLDRVSRQASMRPYPVPSFNHEASAEPISVLQSRTSPSDSSALDPTLSAASQVHTNGGDIISTASAVEPVGSMDLDSQQHLAAGRAGSTELPQPQRTPHTAGNAVDRSSIFPSEQQQPPDGIHFSNFAFTEPDFASLLFDEVLTPTHAGSSLYQGTMNPLSNNGMHDMTWHHEPSSSSAGSNLFHQGDSNWGAFNFGNSFEDFFLGQANPVPPVNSTSQAQRMPEPPSPWTAPPPPSHTRAPIAADTASSGVTESSAPQKESARDAMFLLNFQHGSKASVDPWPGVQHGLKTRHPSPELPSEANAEWPTRWDPTRDATRPEQSALGLHIGEPTGSPVSDTFSLFKPIDDVGRLAMLELLRFAELKVDKYHYFYVRLSRVSLATLNHFLSLYFSRVHPYLPFLHAATFDPQNVSGFLLGSLVAAGAQFSDVTGSSSFSHVLAGLVQEAIDHIVKRNNHLNRDMQMWQALMIWSLQRYSGIRKTLEKTEVFRNAYTVALGKMHAFDGTIRLPPAVATTDEDLEHCWTTWKQYESRRRTGFCCFLTDAEFTIFLDRPAGIGPKEMKDKPPCADVLWEANTAQEWRSILTRHPGHGAENLAVCHILDYTKNHHDLVKIVRQTSLGATVLVQILHVALYSMRQAGTFAPSVMRMMKLDYRRALLAVGAGSNEFLPFRQDRSVGWTAFAILYHLAQITLRVPLPKLLIFAGKETTAEALNLRAELVNEMRAEAISCREMALHAGRLLRLIRESQATGTYELFSLFFSACALHLYASTAVTESVEPGEYSRIENERNTIALDVEAPGAVELDWAQNGGAAATVASINLSAPNAKYHILDYVVSIYDSRTNWGLNADLARILERMNPAKWSTQRKKEGEGVAYLDFD